ncbi:MAG: DUF1810 domain-containing protein [Bacilli bacterium]|nr:DUF1810 domain-containing protein [Bacilli bacterium]
MQRFIDAQNQVFDKVVEELSHGFKETHWMWYIFPQITGLGQSTTAKYYELQNIDEINEYINNELLMQRLYTLCSILKKQTNSAEEIFGYPDVLKFKSSMTLFDYYKQNEIFNELLEKFYQGQRDEETIKIIKKLTK